ncbi:MAG: NfeD family protein [Ruminococcus sp.]|nr:NfeD family protein [Ruminococcus sp.]MCD7801284.1 NfeD family protein [Ruminococcus sp.]
MSIIIWAIILVLTILLEIATMQLVSIWFAVASLVALISAMFVEPLTQFVIFVLVSFVLLVFTRPLLKKVMVEKHQPTNYELDIGKVATVIETIDTLSQTGRVSLNGVDWTATSVDNSIIENGSQVVVEEVEGSKLLVKKL